MQGVIDKTYTGIVKVLPRKSFISSAYGEKKYNKIAQLILEKIVKL
jgi:dUTPase